MKNKYLYFVIIWLCCKVNIPLYADDSDDLRGIKWICDAECQPLSDSLLYEEHPAPIFRKEFKVNGKIKSATLFITVAGYYTASVNGVRIGQNYLDPAWTNYSKRIYYSQYDVTKSISKGNNCLGVELGNGFYNSLPMKLWGWVNLRKMLPTGRPLFIARLHIEYVDGKIEDIVTDRSWKYNYSPIIKNNVYLGTVYDAQREIEGWNKPGLNEAKWVGAIEKPGPGGKLQSAFFQPVQIIDKIKPVKVSSQKNVYIVDFGVVFTGIYKIKLIGIEGDTIKFRFGERLYDDGSLNPMTTVCGQIKRKGVGGAGAPDIAGQEDRYIFGNKKEIWYQPDYTFHVYRYMEISGLSQAPKIYDIEGIALSSNVKNDNHFSCSSALLNSIQTATVRTFLNNMISVQSDCAAREKFGYGGDLNATSESFICNFDMQKFYRKTVYDWVDAINDTSFIDTAPFVGINYCGLNWESAFLTTQYKLYVYYNDIEFVREMYDLDLKWMQKVAKIHPEGIVDKGLSDHESLQNVPVELTGTTIYIECARIMKVFASLMNDKTTEEHFSQLEQRLKEAIVDMFWKRQYPKDLNRQTLYATLLYYDLIPAREKKQAVDSLLKAVAAGPSGHLTTGIFGTKFVLEAMSANGYADRVFDMVNSKVYPGWGFMIDQGATTIWETWKESDNTFSNCHPMFGSVTEWFYRWLAGIRPIEEYPGFKKFTISPTIPNGLNAVNCNYRSPAGKIISNWKREGRNTIFHITIPEGSVAELILPVTKGKMSVKKTGDKNVSAPVNTEKFELDGGDYKITVSE